MKKTIVTITTGIFLLLMAGLVSCKKSNDAATPPAEAITVIPQSQVPAVVVSTFNSRFAGATEVEWHKSSASGNSFEVEFNHQNQRHSVGFDDKGTEKHHNISCTSGAVPQAVLNAFRARNPNDNVYEWKLTSDGNWKAHFLRNNVKWETTFTPAGVFVKEEHE